MLIFFFCFCFFFQFFIALKNSYVDVFNPSGAPSKPIEPVMAPAMPAPSIPQSGFFVPDAGAGGGYNTQPQQPNVSTYLLNLLV